MSEYFFVIYSYTQLIKSYARLPHQLLILSADYIRCIDVTATGDPCPTHHESRQSPGLVRNHRQCPTRQYRIRGPTQQQDSYRRKTIAQNAQNLRKYRRARV